MGGMGSIAAGDGPCVQGGAGSCPGLCSSYLKATTTVNLRVASAEDRAVKLRGSEYPSLEPRSPAGSWAGRLGWRQLVTYSKLIIEITAIILIGQRSNSNSI